MRRQPRAPPDNHLFSPSYLQTQVFCRLLNSSIGSELRARSIVTPLSSIYYEEFSRNNSLLHKVLDMSIKSRPLLLIAIDGQRRIQPFPCLIWGRVSLHGSVLTEAPLLMLGRRLIANSQIRGPQLVISLFCIPQTPHT